MYEEERRSSKSFMRRVNTLEEENRYACNLIPTRRAPTVWLVLVCLGRSISSMIVPVFHHGIVWSLLVVRDLVVEAALSKCNRQTSSLCVSS